MSTNFASLQLILSSDFPWLQLGLQPFSMLFWLQGQLAAEKQAREAAQQQADGLVVELKVRQHGAIQRWETTNNM